MGFGEAFLGAPQQAAGSRAHVVLQGTEQPLLLRREADAGQFGGLGEGRGAGLLEVDPDPPARHRVRDPEPGGGEPASGPAEAHGRQRRGQVPRCEGVGTPPAPGQPAVTQLRLAVVLGPTVGTAVDDLEGPRPVPQGHGEEVEGLTALVTGPGAGDHHVPSRARRRPVTCAHGPYFLCLPCLP
ncbi:hypothetical protein ACFFX0_06840 [Citricoccus parietis]|uniref:Uncharacterized protein n=1 Tax=Citricoccus parietis TaxID=592307 RepID=A0ABV5FW62_9MICC